MGLFDSLMKPKNVDLNSEEMRSLLSKGESFNRQGSSKEAVDIFNTILKKDSKNIIALTGKGVGLGSLGYTYKALKIFEEVIKISPNNTFAWTGKGIALYSSQKFEDAIQALDKALEIDPGNYIGLGCKGIALSSLNKTEESLLAFEKTVSLNPNDAVGWIGRGRTLTILNKYRDAEEAINIAINIDQNNAHAWATKGFFLRNTGKYHEAIQACKTAVNINDLEGDAWGIMYSVFLTLGIKEEVDYIYANKRMIMNTSHIDLIHEQAIHYMKLLASAEFSDNTLKPKLFIQGLLIMSQKPLDGSAQKLVHMILNDQLSGGEEIDHSVFRSFQVTAGDSIDDYAYIYASIRSHFEDLGGSDLPERTTMNSFQASDGNDGKYLLVYNRPKKIP